jgi:HTH-type transcriptional regulator/antitoxin HigA
MSRYLTFTIEQFKPDYAVHPGGTLKEVLDEAGLSQADLARSIGISQKHISRVITGKAGIGPDLALRLERELRVDATFWARYQAAYDVHVARLRGDE